MIGEFPQDQRRRRLLMPVFETALKDYTWVLDVQFGFAFNSETHIQNASVINP
jgi:hypothetical protein